MVIVSIVLRFVERLEDALAWPGKLLQLGLATLSLVTIRSGEQVTPDGKNFCREVSKELDGRMGFVGSMFFSVLLFFGTVNCMGPSGGVSVDFASALQIFQFVIFLAIVGVIWLTSEISRTAVESLRLPVQPIYQRYRVADKTMSGHDLPVEVPPPKVVLPA